MKQVGDGLDRFVDRMNPQIRTAVIKNERGETNVTRASARRLAGPAASMWTGVSGDLGKIAKAYRVAP